MEKDTIVKDLEEFKRQINQVLSEIYATRSRLVDMDCMIEDMITELNEKKT